MRVKWLGHAAFLITADNGTKIITDPFGDYAGLRYELINEEADVVTVSHDHGDHAGGKVKGNPKLIKGTGTSEVKGIVFKGVETYHDTSKGKERGDNTIFCFAVEGVRVCHLGDLGHPLSDSETAEVGKVDVLLIPVGGLYTIDADTASKICDQLKPRIVIPMHFKTGKCDFPISGVDDFLKGKTGVRKLDSSEVELKSEQLPAVTEVIVLRHAL